MKALVWHGRNDVRFDTVPDPTIGAPRDAIVKVTSTAICGSGHIMRVPAMGEKVSVSPLTVTPAV